jgi:hypothetical protein
MPAEAKEKYPFNITPNGAQLPSMALRWALRTRAGTPLEIKENGGHVLRMDWLSNEFWNSIRRCVGKEVDDYTIRVSGGGDVHLQKGALIAFEHENKWKPMPKETALKVFAGLSQSQNAIIADSVRGAIVYAIIPVPHPDSMLKLIENQRTWLVAKLGVSPVVVEGRTSIVNLVRIDDILHGVETLREKALTYEVAKLMVGRGEQLRPGTELVEVEEPNA